MKNILFTILIFAALLVSTFSVSAQADLKKVDQYIEKARQDWDVPGMAVAIVKDGKIIHSKGYGVIEAGKEAKVNENTLFAIASNSKAFVASVIANLVEEGKLNWDDKVKDHLPWFELYDSYVSHETTVEDLLCHRVGLGTFSGDVIWYKRELSAEQLIKNRLAHVPQAYSFRAGYGYSNLMFITAGELIKSVTGKTWDQQVKEDFFDPMNMQRTISSITQLDKKGNYASPHKPIDGKNTPIPWVNWDNMGAAGGIVSSANDMAQWLLLNTNSGIWNSDTLLDPAQQNILWTPHNNYILSEGSKAMIPGRHFSGYGLGWSLQDYYGRMIAMHGGGYDGMYSRVMVVPDEKLGIVILTNSMKGLSTPLAYYILNAYIKKDNRDWSNEFLQRSKSNDSRKKLLSDIRSNRKADTEPSVPVNTYTGTYYSGMYGEITVKEENEKLRLHFSDAPALSATLTHWHYDTWEIQWDEIHAWFDFGTVQFVLDNNLKVTGMKFDVPNGDIFFHELEITKVNK